VELRNAHSGLEKAYVPLRPELPFSSACPPTPCVVFPFEKRRPSDFLRPHGGPRSVGLPLSLFAYNALYAPRRVYAEPERPDACKALIRRESLVPAN
jgi:hypothetical protein